MRNDKNEGGETLPAVQQTPEEIIASKRHNWGNLGELTHHKITTFTEEAQAVKSGLPMPQKIEDINATDAALKVAKQKTNALVEERKKVTNLFNPVVGKLMAPEKDLIEVYIPSVEKKLIELKRDKKTADDLKKAKDDELVRLREEAIKYINDYDLLFKTEINKKVTGGFEYALSDGGNITIDALPEYLLKVKGMFKAQQFVTPKMNVVTKNVTLEEFDVIWEEVKEAIKPADFYVGTEKSLYEVEVDKKFEFYEVALLNKPGAMAQSQSIAAKTEEELKKQNASANISATLQSMASSSTATVSTDATRGLKQKFELDMVENEQNALLIIAAFVGSINSCRQYVKAGWFKISVTQMGAALVALKNNDAKFEITGIKFKLVDKL